MRAMVARKIIAARKAVGRWQAALARKAGIRVETLNRLDQAPTRSTCRRCEESFPPDLIPRDFELKESPMPSLQKVFASILSGRSDANTRFADLRRVLTALAFSERIKGGHHIFSRHDIVEIVNLQPLSGGKAKPYQVKQVRQLITKYALALTK